MAEYASTLANETLAKTHSVELGDLLVELLESNDKITSDIAADTPVHDLTQLFVGVFR